MKLHNILNIQIFYIYIYGIRIRLLIWLYETRHTEKKNNPCQEGHVICNHSTFGFFVVFLNTYFPLDLFPLDRIFTDTILLIFNVNRMPQTKENYFPYSTSGLAMVASRVLPPENKEGRLNRRNQNPG